MMKKKREKLSQAEAFALGTGPQFIESLRLGPWTSYSLLHDPKHMCFVLSRYKFCAKMLEGKDHVLEVGCGDGFGIPIMAQAVKRVLAIDVDDRLIDGNRSRLGGIKNAAFRKLNICEDIPGELFDAVFSLDVIEHLDRKLNEPFMRNQCRSLKEDGVCIIGTPNITANKYATDRSRVQHINLKSQQTLRGQMERYFRNVFMFSMNDEVVHTGYAPMAHYVFGMGVGVKGGRTSRD
jgi:2-polyprenyl-3-methyl-5-hydroxy-6-metoxy-1,4-benzoquinol methylase